MSEEIKNDAVVAFTEFLEAPDISGIEDVLDSMIDVFLQYKAAENDTYDLSSDYIDLLCRSAKRFVYQNELLNRCGTIKL